MECGVLLLLVMAVAVVIAVARKSGKRGRAFSAPQRERGADPPSRTTADLTIELVIDRKGRVRVADEQVFRSDADSFWKPFGTTESVHGFNIDGSIYVGQNLGAAHGWGIEPALIDPLLPIDKLSPNRSGGGIQYWPSYADISPSSRAAYLEWLSTGRSDPATYIGYVFLYFYGLERRYFFDSLTSPVAQSERPLITTEIERLLRIYSYSGSFRGYASSFVEAARVTANKGRIHLLQPPEISGFDVPLSVRAALGEFAVLGKPLPSEWAIAWLRGDRSRSRRTPIDRCPEEFNQLFTMRYREKFGDGLVIQPNKSKLKDTYRAASASLGEISIDTGDLPDVTALNAPMNKLEKLADDCANDLDAFSRWIGRNPNGRESLAAVSLLPAELVQESHSPSVSNLISFLKDRVNGRASALIAADELFLYWPSATPAKMKRNEAVLLSQALQKIGFGIEPDVRFGGTAPESGEHIVIFPLAKDAPSAPSPGYSAAAMLLHLACVVSSADEHASTEERAVLEEHLEAALHLSSGERARLSARLEWLLHKDPGTARLKKQLEKLGQTERKSIGEFLIGVAAADGHIAPAEVNALTKIYKLLGLPPEEVYGDLHGAAVSQVAGEEPVPVLAAVKTDTGYRIPRERKTEITLDADTIERKLAETASVSALLSEIFAEEEAPSFTPPPSLSVKGGVVARLGIHHAAFLQALATRTEWQRSDVEQLAADISLLTDGALEKINDLAYEECGEPFWEGTEVIQVNDQVARELTS